MCAPDLVRTPSCAMTGVAISALTAAAAASKVTFFIVELLILRDETDGSSTQRAARCSLFRIKCDHTHVKVSSSAVRGLRQKFPTSAANAQQTFRFSR